jgi:hypothetical protein
MKTFDTCPNCSNTHWEQLDDKATGALLCSLCGLRQNIDIKRAPPDYPTLWSIQRRIGGKDGMDVVWSIAWRCTIVSNQTSADPTVHMQTYRFDKLLPFDLTKEKLDQYLLLQ